MRNPTRRISRLLLAAALLVATAACGDDDSSSADGSADASEAPESFEIRQTHIGFANEINWVWAVEKGIFEAHGVDFSPVQTGGGSAGLAAVMSGAADIGFVGGTDAIKAFQQGFPIRIVGMAYGNVHPAQPNGRGVVVGSDTGITEPCDLVGRKFGVDELGGIGHIYAAAWVRNAGCDPTDVNFIALPSGQLHTALETGRVDAAGLNAVRAQDLVARGVGVLLTDPMSEVGGDVAYAVFVATESFVEENGDALEAWMAALDESLAQITDPANEDEVLQVMAEHGGTTVEILRSTANEPQLTRIDPAVLQRMVDVMVQEGYLAEPIETSALLAPIALP